MEAAFAATRVPTELAGLPKPNAWSRPAGLAGLVGSALAHLAGACALLAALAGVYTGKRRLGIDVIPGADVLPDPQIEAWIDAVADLFGR